MNPTNKTDEELIRDVTWNPSATPTERALAERLAVSNDELEELWKSHRQLEEAHEVLKERFREERM